MRSVLRLFSRVALLLCLIAPSATAETYWVFFAPAPGWSSGDPVPSGYSDRVRDAGATVRTVSRYFHAVSAEFDGDPAALEGIPGATGVQAVRKFRRAPEPSSGETAASRPFATAADSVYGYLYGEVTALNIPPLHARGLTGNGIVIGVLDAGFTALSTTGCLTDMTIMHTRNFVRGGTDVSGDSHGSLVLACIGGRVAGAYTAPAYGASFLLAVTEYAPTETPSEEDYWVAGIEWCDSLGADIVSSSLGYNTFDDSTASYSKSDMNGKTSLVARAAEIAVEHGIVVVTCAGNEGDTDWRTILTPGDAEHAITVGAVTQPATGTPSIADFSSVGPTADGRIKPDVVAPGVSVSLPALGTAGYYSTGSGTSFATPLVSGLCALLLEAHPEWTPANVMTALRSTALDLGAAGADTLYGYGLPNGLAALDATVGVDDKSVADHPAVFAVGMPHPNPFNPSVTVPVRLFEPSRVAVRVYDITGRLVSTLVDGTMSAGEHAMVWNARGCASGIYLARVSAGGRTESRKVVLVK